VDSRRTSANCVTAIQYDVWVSELIRPFTGSQLNTTATVAAPEHQDVDPSACTQTVSKTRERQGSICAGRGKTRRMRRQQS
jgi:hypothetical protein